MNNRQVAADAAARAIRDVLDGFEGIEGALVYGSVARGTATAASDVDVLVVTTRDLQPVELNRMRSVFEGLQVALGYRPDTEHVVEVFAARRCEQALNGPLVLRAVHMAACAQDLDRLTRDSDDLEILRALLGHRLTLIASPVVDSLTALAGKHVTAAARRLDVPTSDVLAGVGLHVTRPTDPSCAPGATGVPR